MTKLLYLLLASTFLLFFDRSHIPPLFLSLFSHSPAVRAYLKDRPLLSTKTPPPSQTLTSLELENHYLRQELQKAQKLLHAREDIATYSPLPASVLARDPATWGHSLWINKGTKNSPPHTIEKNSPVVIGRIALGIVEEVGDYRSRVRLLTDPKLALSVEVVQNNIPVARGILHGTGHTLWRAKRPSQLEGEGFYSLSSRLAMQEGDLLQTSGLDGLFPKGFFVARLHTVRPDPKRSYSAQIEALALFDAEVDPDALFVLPPNL